MSIEQRQMPLGEPAPMWHKISNIAQHSPARFHADELRPPATEVAASTGCTQHQTMSCHPHATDDMVPMTRFAFVLVQGQQQIAGRSKVEQTFHPQAGQVHQMRSIRGVAKEDLHRLSRSYTDADLPFVNAFDRYYAARRHVSSCHRADTRKLQHR
ncbi:MAG: hypothetical protein BGP25_02935 [Lysobacterales bacterium 63-13]|nr:MAG: hypothetical protein BGP25_02935 [Xanthomonadales bacterium 63-13]